MVRALSDPGLRDYERKIIEDIAGYGSHVTSVVSPTSDPDWSYTIGLHHSYSHQEVLVFGLRADVAHALLNDVHDLIVEGHRFEAGTETYLLLKDLRCAFRTVRPVWYDVFIGGGFWFYHHQPVPVVQMFWPDGADRFPWEPGFDPSLIDRQFLLYHTDPASARTAEFLQELEDRGLWPPRDSA
jgi:hypothetical protein